jgi:hypothetical protein
MSFGQALKGSGFEILERFGRALGISKKELTTIINVKSSEPKPSKVVPN